MSHPRLGISHKLWNSIFSSLTYMMRSRGISRKSDVTFSVFYLIEVSIFGEVHFAENSTWIGPVVPRLWANEDSQNNRTSFLLLPISHNQYCRLPTDPAFPLDRNTYYVHCKWKLYKWVWEQNPGMSFWWTRLLFSMFQYFFKYLWNI